LNGIAGHAAYLAPADAQLGMFDAARLPTSAPANIFPSLL
jgi:hypothetical protein